MYIYIYTHVHKQHIYIYNIHTSMNIYSQCLYICIYIFIYIFAGHMFAMYICGEYILANCVAGLTQGTVLRTQL